MPRSPSPDQGALFAPPPPPEAVRHAGDPHVCLPADPWPTQVAAAAAALPRTGTWRRWVLDAIGAAWPVRPDGSGGLTDEEIEDALGIGGNTERPRRKKLEEAGLILDSGATRPTSTGKAAIVWVAAGLAEEVARGA
jgi:hypothetical protein